MNAIERLRLGAWRIVQRALGRSDVYVDGRLYMRRWLLGPKWFFGLRVHHIAMSDSDREFHDHPFSFVSFVLSGGYYEIFPVRSQKGEIVDRVQRWRAPLSFAFRRAEDLHRVRLARDGTAKVEFGGNDSSFLGKVIEVGEKTAWTICLRGPYRREWGFVGADGKWVHWEKFTGDKDKAPSNRGAFAAKSST